MRCKVWSEQGSRQGEEARPEGNEEETPYDDEEPVFQTGLRSAQPQTIAAMKVQRRPHGPPITLQ